MDLTFTSRLAAKPAKVWDWAISSTGLNTEMAPLMKMTGLGRLDSGDHRDIDLGARLGTSWILLFGFVPIERLQVHITELEYGRRFVEQSHLLSMRFWRHERTFEPIDGGCELTDTVTFEPYLLAGLVGKIIRTLFNRRHAYLRKKFGTLNRADGETNRAASVSHHSSSPVHNRDSD